MRLLILAALTVTTACAMELPGGVSTDREDHRLHAIGGALIATAVHPVSCYLTRDMEPGFKRFMSRVLIDTAASAVIGVAKERVYDRDGRGTQDTSDAWATVYGGAAAAVTLSITF